MSSNGWHTRNSLAMLNLNISKNHTILKLSTCFWDPKGFSLSNTSFSLWTTSSSLFLRDVASIGGLLCRTASWYCFRSCSLLIRCSCNVLSSVCKSNSAHYFSNWIFIQNFLFISVISAKESFFTIKRTTSSKTVHYKTTAHDNKIMKLTS